MEGNVCPLRQRDVTRPQFSVLCERWRQLKVGLLGKTCFSVRAPCTPLLMGTAGDYAFRRNSASYFWQNSFCSGFQNQQNNYHCCSGRGWRTTRIWRRSGHWCLYNFKWVPAQFLTMIDLFFIAGWPTWEGLKSGGHNCIMITKKSLSNIWEACSKHAPI